MEDIIGIDGICVNAIIGINPEERINEQNLLIDLKIICDTKKSLSVDDINICHNYSLITKRIYKYVKNSSFFTIESLANNVLEYIIKEFSLKSAEMTIKKTEALSKANYPYITIKRTCDDYIGDVDGIYLGIGSNIGNKYQYILNCLEKIKQANIKILRTSNMYLTKPMYVEKGDDFYNCVIKINTKYSPIELLKVIKDIESDMGKNIKDNSKGPRIIDIDILLYNNEIIHTNDLIIPHQSIIERNFVVQPLLDISDFHHPVTHILFSKYMTNLKPAQKIIPIQHDTNKYIIADEPFYMQVLNATPDSFSGDGILSNNAAEKNIILEKYTKCDIIDIGGESTRPGHDIVKEDIEIKRIEEIYDDVYKKYPEKLISIDTRKYNVAEYFIKKGCHIINDVSGMTFDKNMIDLIRLSKIPVIICNNLSSDNKDDFYDLIRDYENNGLYKWNIIVDIGVGINKTFDQTLSIWKNISVIDTKYTTMLGHSRKKHIDKFLDCGLDNNNLDIATAFLIQKGFQYNIFGSRVHTSQYIEQIKKIWYII